MRILYCVYFRLVLFSRSTWGGFLVNVPLLLSWNCHILMIIVNTFKSTCTNRMK